MEATYLKPEVSEYKKRVAQMTSTDLSVQQIAEIMGITKQQVLDIQTKISGK